MEEESVSQNIFDEESKKQENQKLKVDNSTLSNNNSESELFNSIFNSIFNKIDNMINMLKTFSKTLKSSVSEISNSKSTDYKTINENQANTNETHEEIKNEQNSSIDFKKITIEIANCNTEIDAYFDDIKKKIERIKLLSSLKEISIKDKKENAKSSSLSYKISSAKSTYNINGSFKDDINNFIGIYEEELKNKSESGKKTKLSLNEINNFNSYDELSHKIPLIGEMNNFIHKELNDSRFEKEKNSKQKSNINISDFSGKTLFEMISEIFKVDKYTLAYQLLMLLDQIYLYYEVYKAEVFKNFNSKIKKIYDSKYDDDSLLVFITKIFGKKNIITYFTMNNKDINNVQIIFLKGKYKYIDNYFHFTDGELYSYGNFQLPNSDRKYPYEFMRIANNSRMYTKIENDYIYIIFYAEEKIILIAKIRNNFLKNPILTLNAKKEVIEEFFRNNSEDKVSELFNKYETKEFKFNEIILDDIPEE